MEKGLGKFCRDVDRLSKELWQADHFKAEVPRTGDHLILVKDSKVFKIEVVDAVLSTVENTGVVTAKIVASPLLQGKESRVGEILSGSYADGESVWTNKKGESYQDYRLFIKSLIREKPFHRITGRLRKVVKANNGAINIVLTDPTAPSLFQQSCTLRDTLAWSKTKRHYLSVFTTVFNAILSLTAMLHNQSIAAVLMAVCSAICFLCLHVELRRMKQQRDHFTERKAMIDKDYLAIKQDAQGEELTLNQRGLLRINICRYHVLIMDYLHPHFRGLATSWAGRLDSKVETLPAQELFYYIDQYRDALDIPD